MKAVIKRRVFKLCLKDFVSLLQRRRDMGSFFYAVGWSGARNARSLSRAAWYIGCDRHLEFLKLCITDFIDMFQI